MSESKKVILNSKNYGTKPKKLAEKGNPMAQTKKMGLQDKESTPGKRGFTGKRESGKADFLKGKNEHEMGLRVRRLASKKNKVILLFKKDFEFLFI